MRRARDDDEMGVPESKVAKQINPNAGARCLNCVQINFDHVSLCIHPPPLRKRVRGSPAKLVRYLSCDELSPPPFSVLKSSAPCESYHI